jgi:hypothetical protein
LAEVAQLVKRTLQDLVRDLADRRRLSETPPVVLLGAGASAQAGLATMQKLYEFVGVPGFDEFVTYIEARTDNERFRLLAEFLQTQDPYEVTPGYRALAALCEHAYFDLVLTTNFDPLLDDALVTAGLRRRDYLLLINGCLRTDRLRWLLSSHSPRVKVLKLHGDLFHRFMAWTPTEMQNYLEEIAPVLNAFLMTRDFLVVGTSLRDDRIRELVVQAGGAIWYLSRSDVPAAIAELRDVRAVTGPEQAFEEAMTALAHGLGVAYETTRPVEEEPKGRSLVAAAAAASTTDDLMAASVGLTSTEEGPPQMTGFVLADPRVIVTDGYVGNTGMFNANRIIVITSTGRRLTTRGRLLISTHPFGPWVLEVPPELLVSGLRLDPSPLRAGDATHIAVAAGERVGLSSGSVISGLLETVSIAEIGEVPDLVHVRCATAPGSSGAPIVDAARAVRGFVVAASNNADQPDTYIYPAERWHAQLTQPAAAPPRGPSTSRRAPRKPAKPKKTG